MTATETEQDLMKEAQQRVHADLNGISDKKLEELRKNDNGGELCMVCKRKGCRIGPMGRG